MKLPFLYPFYLSIKCCFLPPQNKPCTSFGIYAHLLTKLKLDRQQFTEVSFVNPVTYSCWHSDLGSHHIKVHTSNEMIIFMEMCGVTSAFNEVCRSMIFSLRLCIVKTPIVFSSSFRWIYVTSALSSLAFLAEKNHKAEFVK